MDQRFDRPDRMDDDAMNRILWQVAMGDAPYPGMFAGAHGRGLKGLRLVREKTTIRWEWCHEDEGLSDL